MSADREKTHTPCCRECGQSTLHGGGVSGPGLDELMIVNPEPEESLGYFLSEDGDLYEIHPPTVTERGDPEGHRYLGSDGNLYEVLHDSVPEGKASQGAADRTQERFFLGDDGMLLEVTDH